MNNFQQIMLKKKKDMRYLKLLFVSFLIVLQISLNAQSQSRDSKEMQQSLQKLSTMYYLINNFYVDTADLGSLTEEAIVAILKELDPHSAYISKEDVEKALNL